MRKHVVIPIYNRPVYLQSCLDSLLVAADTETEIFLCDDGSEMQLISQICSKFIRLAKERGIEVYYQCMPHRGVAPTMAEGLKYAPKNAMIMNLDSDFIVKPTFFKRLEELYNMYKHDDAIILTGFNTLTHRIRAHGHGYCVKATCGGGNMAFTYATLQKYVLPALLDNMWDWRICIELQKVGGAFICTTPSQCQHIGASSTLGHPRADVAEDF